MLMSDEKSTNQGGERDRENVSQPGYLPEQANMATGHAPNQRTHLLLLKGDEPFLLRALVEQLAFKEGLRVEHDRRSTQTEYGLRIGPAGDEGDILFVCRQAADEQYLVDVQRLSDHQQAHRLMELLEGLIKQWYQELQKSFFR
jgi:hypothetical protein